MTHTLIWFFAHNLQFGVCLNETIFSSNLESIPALRFRLVWKIYIHGLIGITIVKKGHSYIGFLNWPARILRCRHEYPYFKRRAHAAIRLLVFRIMVYIAVQLCAHFKSQWIVVSSHNFLTTGFDTTFKPMALVIFGLSCPSQCNLFLHICSHCSCQTDRGLWARWYINSLVPSLLIKDLGTNFCWTGSSSIFLVLSVSNHWIHQHLFYSKLFWSVTSSWRSRFSSALLHFCI